MMEFLASLERSELSTMLRESGSIWAYPTVLTLHTMGLGVLVGAHWVLSLRLLGVGADVPLFVFRRLFRYMWLGFWINLVTGVLLFIQAATTKAVQRVFWVKLAFVFAGVALVLITRRVVYPRNRHQEMLGIPSHGRALALSAIVVWAAAITAGRLMAYF